MTNNNNLKKKGILMWSGLTIIGICVVALTHMSRITQSPCNCKAGTYSTILKAFNGTLIPVTLVAVGFLFTGNYKNTRLNKNTRLIFSAVGVIFLIRTIISHMYLRSLYKQNCKCSFANSVFVSYFIIFMLLLGIVLI